METFISIEINMLECILVEILNWSRMESQKVLTKGISETLNWDSTL
jgi:hypothetical protein